MFLNKLLLLVITANFINYIEERHVKTLLTFYIIKNHNKEEQFAVLFSVLQDYNIIKKLRTVVADNSNINDTLC